MGNQITLDKVLQESRTFHQRLISNHTAEADNALTRYAIEHWRDIIAPERRSDFEKRLRWGNITKHDLAAAIGTQKHVQVSETPWLEILKKLQNAASDSLEECPDWLSQSTNDRLAFSAIWQPCSQWGLKELKHRCQDLSGLNITDRSWQGLAQHLLERICWIGEQVLWEEFTKVRPAGAVILAQAGVPLHKETSYFQSFVKKHLSTGYSLLLDQYPVLGRLIAQSVQLWLEASYEMLERIWSDKDELYEAFKIPSEASISSIHYGLGDHHHGGRTVSILKFETAQHSVRVVYKPKPMEIEKAFQDFLNTLNRFNDQPLRTLTVMTKPDYGFTEYVEHKACNTAPELEQFYHNAGRMLGILYILGCTDCHHENLIAHGDQLMLIDTETLLEPVTSDEATGNVGNLNSLNKTLDGSVFATGLLPQWIDFNATRNTADLSALGVAAPGDTITTKGWIDINTDVMRRGDIEEKAELPTSLPIKIGQQNPITYFVDNLCSGFENQLHLFSEHRNQLLKALNLFQGISRRFITRATRVYASVQLKMFEPASLRTAFDHGVWIEQLGRTYLLAEEKNPYWSVFESEIKQMEQLDIPMFDHKIDSRDLQLTNGLEPIRGFMKTSGLQAAKERLNALNANDIKLQLRLIKGTIQAKKKQTCTASNEVQQKSSLASTSFVPSNELRLEAERLAEMIWSAAIGPENHPQWLGIETSSDGTNQRFGILGPSLYDGTAGLSLLFAALSYIQGVEGHHEREKYWRDKADATLQQMLDDIQINREASMYRWIRDEPLGLAGIGGIITTLQLYDKLFKTCHEPQIEILLRGLKPQRINDDTHLDLMGGIAGLIGPLLCSELPIAKQIAISCGQRLLKEQTERGGWQSPTSANPLTGFSHGAAGIGAALARLAQVTQRKDFADGAQKAFEYERNTFDEKVKNWPDFRQDCEGHTFKTAWCHGAAGIALSRLTLQGTPLWNATTKHEVQVALNTTRLQSISTTANKDHLCCGRLGLSAILRAGSKYTQMPELESAAKSLEALVLHQARESDEYQFLNTNGDNANFPGLFTGSAGAALQLLESSTDIGIINQILSCRLLSD